MTTRFPAPSERQSEKGNVLWFILIGIALLAAITILLSRSGSSVDQSGDVEQLRLKATQMMRYAKSIEAGIQNLMLQGCSENEISFENTSSTVDYTNAKSPVDNACHIFDSAGAGLRWASFSDLEFSAISDEIAFHNGITVWGIGESDSGNSGVDLVIGIITSQALCDQINKEMGATISVTTDMRSDMDDWDNPYVGSFSSQYSIGKNTAPTIAPAFYGFPTGCALDMDGNLFFYQVLIPR